MVWVDLPSPHYESLLHVSRIPGFAQLQVRRDARDLLAVGARVMAVLLPDEDDPEERTVLSMLGVCQTTGDRAGVDAPIEIGRAHV